MGIYEPWRDNAPRSIDFMASVADILTHRGHDSALDGHVGSARRHQAAPVDDQAPSDDEIGAQGTRSPAPSRSATASRNRGRRALPYSAASFKGSKPLRI